MLKGVRLSTLSLKAKTKPPSGSLTRSTALFGFGKHVGSGSFQWQPPSSETIRKIRPEVLRQYASNFPSESSTTAGWIN
jgi:hypothetical protein